MGDKSPKDAHKQSAQKQKTAADKKAKAVVVTPEATPLPRPKK